MKKILAVFAVTLFLAGCAASEEKPKVDYSMFDQLWTHVGCVSNAEKSACSSLCGGEDKTSIQEKDKRKCTGKTYKKGKTNGCYCNFE